MINKIKAWWNGLSFPQKLWVTLAPITIFILDYLCGDDPINIAISTIGILYVAIYTTGTKYNFLLAIVYVSLYSIVCWQNKVYGDVYMNVALIPMYLYSFVYWGKHQVTPHNIDTKTNLLFAGLTAFIAILLNYCLIALGGNYTIYDAANTACTLTAMAFGIFGISSAWIYWTINNIISLWIWIQALNTATGSIAVFLMKAVFLVNGIIGLINFNHLGKAHRQLD